MENSDIIPYPQEIGRVIKNRDAVFIVALNEYKGHVYIDVRLFLKQDKEGTDVMPTRKGISLNLKNVDEMMRLLTVARDRLQEIQPLKKKDAPTEEA